jgi:hypothetical protein
MGAPHYLLQVLDVHVGINLGAPEARVSEDCLDVTEVRVLAQHVSCSLVAKGVRADPAFHPIMISLAVHDEKLMGFDLKTAQGEVHEPPLTDPRGV